MSRAELSKKYHRKWIAGRLEEYFFTSYRASSNCRLADLLTFDGSKKVLLSLYFLCNPRGFPALQEYEIWSDFSKTISTLKIDVWGFPALQEYEIWSDFSKTFSTLKIDVWGFSALQEYEIWSDFWKTFSPLKIDVSETVMCLLIQYLILRTLFALCSQKVASTYFLHNDIFLSHIYNVTNQAWQIMTIYDEGGRWAFRQLRKFLRGLANVSENVIEIQFAVKENVNVALSYFPCGLDSV